MTGVATISTSQPFITYGLVRCIQAGAAFAAATDCKTISNSSGVFKNSAVAKAANNPKALIKCSEGKCLAIDGQAGGFYLSSSDLIKCDAGGGQESGCVIVNHSSYDDKGYILDYGSENFSNLISCTNDDGCSNPTSMVEGYYINAVTPTEIIHCVNTGDKITCSSGAHGGTDPSPKHYYDGINKKVIKCNAANNCAYEDSSLKGYFLNSGNPSKVIKCDGSECEEEATVTSCSRAGQLKKSGGSYYLCVSANDSDTHLQIQSSGANSAPIFTEYKSVVGTNEFPGNNVSGSFTVRNDKDGKVILMESGGLPACGNSCLENKYCITGNIIKKGDAGSNCVVITRSESSPIYFKKDNTIIDTPNASNKLPYVAYDCTYDAASPYNAKSCEMIKGYVSTATGAGSTNTVYCSGWKNDPCQFKATDSLGSICNKVSLLYSSGAKLCTKSSNPSDSVAISPGNVLFSPIDADEYYGISITSSTPSFFALKLTSTSAILSSDTSKFNIKN